MLDPTLTPSRLLRGPEPVGRRLPDVRLADGRHLHELVGPEGLVLARQGAPVPDPLQGLPRAWMPDALPQRFGGHDLLVVRPDHVIASAAPLGPGVRCQAVSHGDSQGATKP